jgi:hypothetical protein
MNDTTHPSPTPRKHRGWLGRARWWRGGTGRSCEALLTDEKPRDPQLASTDPSNAEQAVSAVAATTASRIDASWHRRLGGLVDALVVSVSGVERAETALGVFVAAQATMLRARKTDADARTAARLARSPGGLRLGSRSMTIFEATVLAIEFSFWYQLGTQSLSRSTALFSAERLPALLFATFVPIAGLLTVRLAGKSTAAAVRYRKSERGAARSQTAIAAVSGALLVAGVVITFSLVKWR